MEVIAIKKIILYSGVGAAIIGLLLVIFQMLDKNVRIGQDSELQKNSKKFMLGLWVLFGLCTIATLGIMSFIKGFPTFRGIMLSLLTGCFIPVLLASMESIIKQASDKSKSMPVFKYAYLPLAGIGLSLLYMGLTAQVYGISADNLWLAFVMGSGVGLLIARIACRMTTLREFNTAIDRLEPAVLLACLTLLATIMATQHFNTADIYKAFLPILLLIGLFNAVFISAIPFSVRPGKNVMDTLPALLCLFVILFLGICLYLAVKLNLTKDYNYPLIAGAISSVVLIIVMYGSASSVKRLDFSAGAIGALIIIGGIWFSFKWASGFGVSLYAMSALSLAAVIMPLGVIEAIMRHTGGVQETLAPMQAEMIVEENGKKLSPEAQWSEIMIKALTIFGFFTIFLVLFRVILQKTTLLNNGIDITVADTLTALLLGAITPLVFEGFNLAGGATAPPEDKGLCVGSGLIIFILTLLLAATLIAATGVFYRLEGLGAFPVGLSLSTVITAFVFFSTRKEQSIFKVASSSLWMAASAFSIFLVKYRDIPDQLTRMKKQELVVALIVVVMIVYFFAHWINKKKNEVSKTPKNNNEKSLKVKSVQ